MQKAELRKKYLNKRATLSPVEIDSLSLEIANQSLQLLIWNNSNFHIFLSITEKGEINTDYLLHILQGKDKNIIVPKTDFENQTLSHFLLTDNTVIKKNKWGIPEPEDGIPFPENKIDVVFVPLLAFDKKGHRVGYGKGFYDRFLSLCKPDVIKIGLSFFDVEDVEINAEETDVSLNYCITPKALYRF
jgi:5-formyltetrahydrofolate cyclo-ligase